LAHRFPNKFASKCYKRFPPHLNNVSTFVTGNAHRTRARPWVVTERKSRIYPCAPQLWPPNSPALNPVDYSSDDYLQE